MQLLLTRMLQEKLSGKTLLEKSSTCICPAENCKVSHALCTFCKENVFTKALRGSFVVGKDLGNIFKVMKLARFIRNIKESFGNC